MKFDPRFIQESGHAVYTGNELLVKGALEIEGGVHLVTGYPGSPISGVFDTMGSLSELLEEQGIVARLGANEAISVAMLNGLQMVGGRGIALMKNVGLHVASDALALGVLAGTKGDGGGLIVTGDDPWSDSTQVPADSRYLAEHLRMPILEPSCGQEMKDWVDISFKIGRAGSIYMGMLVTTAQADGGGSVEVRSNDYPVINEKQKVALSYEDDVKPHVEQMVLLPPRTWREEIRMTSRHDAVKKAARVLGVNKIIGAPQRGERVPLGFIASGGSYGYLCHALSEMGLNGRIPILKLGMPYPVCENIVGEFLGQCEQVVVVEERRGFVEKHVHDIATQLRQEQDIVCDVYGKRFPGGLEGFPETRGLNPSLIIETLVPLLRGHRSLPVELTNGNLTTELEGIKKAKSIDIDLPIRTATFCPGCPHRDSSNVLLELRSDLLDADYMERNHRRKPVDMVAHGDTGCYTMLMFPPNEPLMQNYSGMGLGGATGAGVDPFIDNKQIVFMGDGTFYHSGQVAIGQSIYNGQDITYIILENSTTAMTGHQPHESNDSDVMGRVTNALSIERIVKGLVPKEITADVKIVRINPADRDRYRNLLEETILSNGVKVVIADKECGIKYHRRARAAERAEVKEKGFLAKKTFMNIAEEVCEYCLECTSMTGCPALKKVDTDYGSKMQTDFSTCVNDGACARISACPSFEEVTVYRQGPERMGDLFVDLDSLPDPPKPVHADQDIWRCHLAGVGGMGIGLCRSILLFAGEEMGYSVQFLDKKGMAIRSGGVFGQLVYTRSEGVVDSGTSGLRLRSANQFTTPVIPYGKADLLLGLDLLEACRAIDPKAPYRVASSERTSVVLNTTDTPTVLAMMGRDELDQEKYLNKLRENSKDNQFFSASIGDLCERVLDNKVYANVMMLGIAFQLGYLPLKREAIEKAIRKVAGKEFERNLRAFGIGRKLALHPELFEVFARHEYESAKQALRRKVNTLRLWYKGSKGEKLGKQFRVLMKHTFRATRGMRVSDQLLRDVIIRTYDCLIWGGIHYAERYCLRLQEIFHKDHPEYGFEITRAVVHNLAKVMLIKDEVYVAALLTNPEKYRRDRKRYNVNPERGDRIVYKHHNRPEFELFGRPISFEVKTRDWMLRMMSGCQFLRKLMPSWHVREKDFRNWYESLVDRIDWHGERDYQRWLSILSVPADVTGYREVRYPKMERAKRLAEMYFDTPPDQFEAASKHDVDNVTSIELPVVYPSN
ncbi:2-oxoacid:acceptor oxidoreductase family protein [Planctomycetota bacterium]|nr:2-oxoacid:acceptor oxidoreductase family protein [Planctomycetota bacterium]